MPSREAGGKNPVWEEPSPGIKSLVPGLSHTNSAASPLGRVCVSLGNSFVRGMFSCVIKGQMNTALCLSPSTGAEGWRVCPPRDDVLLIQMRLLNTKVASEARAAPAPAGAPLCLSFQTPPAAGESGCGEHKRDPVLPNVCALAVDS